MLKGTLLFLANQRSVYRLVMRHDLLRGLAQRYVAGEELGDGIVVAQTLNTQRLQVTLDHLGESVTNEAEARRSTRAYLEALDAIAREQVEAGVSLKLTQLGLDVSHELCTAHLRALLERTRSLAEATHQEPIFVRIDMESSAYTQRTLDIHRQFWEDEGFRNLGIVLQAYLHRTAGDVERAIEMQVPVRLCKGAYLEPPQVAFARKSAVDANFAHLTERLLRAGTHPAIATHDERLIRHAQDIARRERLPASRFELQMLFGVRRDLQLRLVQQGYRMRVYLPYGEQWYPYLMRRLAERPANLAFFVRSLVLESLAGRRNGAPRGGG
jgi:proline dehydrogenase